MRETTATFHDSDMDAVREAIKTVSGSLDAAESLHALAGIRQQLEECVRLTEERMAALASGREDRDSVQADADQARTAEGLAHAFDRLGRRAPDEDASLTTDPDDYPLF